MLIKRVENSINRIQIIKNELIALYRKFCMIFEYSFDKISCQVVSKMPIGNDEILTLYFMSL